MPSQYEIIVSAKNEAGKVFDSVRRDANKLSEDLKAQRDGLKGFGDVLTGAGAFAGGAIIAKTLNQSVQGMVELRKEFDAGTLSAEEMRDKLAGQIPILGQIWQAGRGIHELFTGEVAEIEKLNREHQATADYLKTRLELQRASVEVGKAEIEQVKMLRQEIAILFSADKERLRLSFGLSNDRGGVNAGLQKNLATVEQKRAAGVAGIVPQLAREEELLRDRETTKGDFIDLNAPGAAESREKIAMLRKQMEQIEADAATARAQLTQQADEAHRLLIIKNAKEQADALQKEYDEQLKAAAEAERKIAEAEAKGRAERDAARKEALKRQADEAKQAADEMKRAREEAEADEAEHLKASFKKLRESGNERAESGDPRFALQESRFLTGVQSQKDDVPQKHLEETKKVSAAVRELVNKAQGGKLVFATLKK